MPKPVKLFPSEVAFWLAGHGLDHTQHTLRLHSAGGADRVQLLVRSGPHPDVESLKVDFQRRFAIRADDLQLHPQHEGRGVVDERN